MFQHTDRNLNIYGNPEIVYTTQNLIKHQNSNGKKGEFSLDNHNNKVLIGMVYL